MPPQADASTGILNLLGSVQPFGQVDLDVISVVLADGRADRSSHWELVGAVS